MILCYTGKTCKIVFGYEGLVATAYLTHDPDSLVPFFLSIFGVWLQGEQAAADVHRRAPWASSPMAHLLSGSLTGYNGLYV